MDGRFADISPFDPVIQWAERGSRWGATCRYLSLRLSGNCIAWRYSTVTNRKQSFGIYWSLKKQFSSSDFVLRYRLDCQAES